MQKIALLFPLTQLHCPSMKEQVHLGKHRWSNLPQGCIKPPLPLQSEFDNNLRESKKYLLECE